jgi:hypothetical protein
MERGIDKLNILIAELHKTDINGDRVGWKPPVWKKLPEKSWGLGGTFYLFSWIPLGYDLLHPSVVPKIIISHSSFLFLSSNNFFRTVTMKLFIIAFYLLMAVTTAEIHLQLVGNNKHPSGAYPLGECQGDCDGDEECEGGLVCFHRDGGDPVPGCLGGEDDNSRTDYCVDPRSLQLVGNNKHPSSAYPLGECQGDCDGDEECEGGLVCFQRDGGDPVPGCLGGEHDNSRTDYCVST